MIGKNGSRYVGVLVLVASLVLTVSCDFPEAGPEVRGIVVITVDGLIPERLSLHGGSHPTPNLERLAAEGRSWTDVWTASPMSRPAAATFLTGLAPDRHGVVDDLFSRLSDDIPTLAEKLAEAGFATAAFPDSHFFRQDPGLLRGFEVVDDPPSLPFDAGAWIPVYRPPDDTSEHFRTWVESLPGDGRYFAWLHFSRPLQAQIRNEDERRQRAAERKKKGLNPGPGENMPELPAAEAIDGAIGTILDAIAASSAAGSTAVFVVGTLGDQSGGEEDAVGPGFSVAERAVRVPLVARMPAGRTAGRDAGAPVWSLDVPATVADLAGIDLADGAEGLSLLEADAGGRVLLSFAWASRDQLGWKALRAARLADTRRIEGYEAGYVDAAGESIEPSVDVARQLEDALASRADPSPPRLKLSTVRDVLTGRGLELDPVDTAGRGFEPAVSRREVSSRLWQARLAVRAVNLPLARRLFVKMTEVDDRSLGGHLGAGLVMSQLGSDQAQETLARAVELYPTHPEVVHWYAHSFWSEAVTEAEQLILALLPMGERDPDLLYDLACARSLAEDYDASERYLRNSIESGFHEFSHMEADPDLRGLRETGRLSEVLRDYRK